MTSYPPEHHLLRDLRFTFEHDVDAGRSRAFMPIVAEMCTDQGHARIGALATLIDVIGGGLAASSAQPDWIATADLTVHLVAGTRPGSVVEARAEVLRAGRTTIVMEVALVDDDARNLGLATMSFSVLPGRATNPDMSEVRESGPSTMAVETSRLAQPLPEMLGVEVRDAAAGVVDVPITDWARNSMGAMQGGVVAMVAELAAEAAAREAARAPLVVSDLHLTYVGFGRVGPVRTQADVLRATPGAATTRVRLVDEGAERRLMTLVTAVATEGFPA
jgi:uncharacterized protein (TIGR00369 family)